MMLSRMGEAIGNLSASLFDPEYRGAIFAVFVLVVLYSIVASLNRLKRTVASVSSELSAIRSTLRKIEWSLNRRDENRSPGAKEEDAMRDLLFRLDDGYPKKDR